MEGVGLVMGYKIWRDEAEERWLPVNGWPGIEVSSMGHVRTWLKRGGGWSNRPHLRKLTMNNRGGYMIVTFTSQGRKATFLVSRLVMDAFAGYHPGLHVRHLNGCVFDNRVENLAWGTRKENEWDKRLHGTAPIGENNGSAKLTAVQVREILALKVQGFPNVEVALKYGVSEATVRSIYTGKTWGNVSSIRFR